MPPWARGTGSAAGVRAPTGLLRRPKTPDAARRRFSHRFVTIGSRSPQEPLLTFTHHLGARTPPMIGESEQGAGRDTE